MCNAMHSWHQPWPLGQDKVWEMAVDYRAGGNVTLRPEWLEDLHNEWLRG